MDITRLLRRRLAPALLGGLLLTLPTALSSQGQCDDIADDCSVTLFPFTSNGQYYRAQLFEGESARLKLTLYQGMVYRIVPCGSADGEKLIFTLYDKNGKMLFTNEKIDNVSYWDFSFGATSDYTVVARFKKGQGCAAILVGYQDEESDDLNVD